MYIVPLVVVYIVPVTILNAIRVVDVAVKSPRKEPMRDFRDEGRLISVKSLTL
jgi:hypothetical protein